MCGVLGLFGTGPVGERLVEGLLTLQHRGQDSAGILTSDTTTHLKKGNGAVAQVFNEKNLARLTGNIGIGHVRYPTIGPGSDEDAQPFYVNAPFGMAMVHNGNVTNYFDLRRELVDKDHRQLTSYSDAEPTLNVLAEELGRTNLARFGPDSVFRAVKATLRRVKGALSVVALVQDRGLLAFRDPFGIKPLVFARQGRDFGFASESVAFDRLGFRRFRDVAPGEAIFIGIDRRVHARQVARPRHRPCIFEYVYFARPDSVMDGIEVYEARLRLGRRLGEEVIRQGIGPDLVAPVPDTARAAATELAATIGVRLREGLIKNRYIPRTFIMPWRSDRTRTVRQKLNPVRSQIKGKNVLLVDDSIVRGTTSKQIVKMVREAGARRVFLAITAPPLRYPCVYGIDMMTRGEFIAKRHSVDKIKKLVDADALVYQTYDGLVEAVRGNMRDRRFCTACFNGEYPTGVTRRDLAVLERERRRCIA